MYHSRVEKHWYSLTIKSRSEGDESELASLTLIGFGHYFKWKLPNWICRSYVVDYFNQYANAYYKVHCVREFGITKFEDSISIYYGIQDEPSWVDLPKRKHIMFNIPWMVMTFVAHRIMDLNQNIFYEMRAKNGRYTEYPNLDYARENVPKISFRFIDNYDWQEGIATCFVEEREWHKGSGICRWLKYFSKPFIRRDLDISYNIEVGKRKGSWKGGVVGCSCDLIPGQDLEQAFKLHCEKNSLTYLGKVE